MPNNNAKVWLITGSSTGFGRAWCWENMRTISFASEIQSLNAELDAWEQVAANTDFETVQR